MCGRTATCHCFMPWRILHHRSSITTRRISNRMSKSSLQAAHVFEDGQSQTSEVNRNECNAVAYCCSCLLHPCCFSCIFWSSLRLEKRLGSRAEVLWEVLNSCKTKALRDRARQKRIVTIPGKMYKMQCTCNLRPLRASSSGKTLKL